MRAALALLLLTAACSPAGLHLELSPAAPAEQVEPVVRNPRDQLPPAPPNHAWVLVNKTDRGFAVCDERIGVLSFVRTRLVGTEEEQQLVAHELDHEDRMLEFPDCTAFWDWFDQDPMLRRIDIEASAYCASIRADVGGGRYSYGQALLLYASGLASQVYGADFSRAVVAIHRYCPPPDADGD
jgi:hypothetical protein